MNACSGRTCTVKQALTALNITAIMCKRPVRDRSQDSIIISGVTGGITTLAFLLRTTDTLLDRRFGWHDVCALAAGICSIALNVLLLLRMASTGLGRDSWTMPFDNIIFVLKMEWIAQIFYWPTTALSKLAFLLMYLRIFPQPRLRIYIYATIALTLCYWVFFEFSIIFYCQPISLVWNGWDGTQEGKCWNINRLLLSAAGVNVFLDTAIVLLPIRELLQLSMTWRRKLEVLGIFTVGLLWPIAGYDKSLNPTWDSACADNWSVLEANASVLCVCIPALRRIVAHRRLGYNDTGVIGSEDAASNDKTEPLPESSETQRSANDDDVPRSFPWEQTTASEQSAGSSKATSRSRDELAIASYIKAAETEHIELHEGPAGEPIRLQRGMNSTSPHVRSPGQVASMDWPSFEDDD
ncbi:hypothetical protein BDW02DRAFT_594007 [Decorospora gaudefroyi]|uniref:Rhodopsin domain-containing protein n=1 Tax=Decorospora gaudefroyi TaxID=184978 RepID=A0A6A5KV64_9PLEO|nr:hypothetical protein BDW02DRAFT_594007 [Decorospora gaudefroyi]